MQASPSGAAKLAALMAHNIRGIDITTYGVKDAERAKAFYRDVMGLRPTWEAESGAEYTLADGATFGIWQGEGPWEPSHGVMFAVDDAKGAADHYRARGARIEAEIFESPVCFMAFGEDSEGNRFILHQRKSGA